MKKVLSVLTSLFVICAMVFSMTGSVVHAESVVDSGYCGKDDTYDTATNIKWEILNNDDGNYTSMMEDISDLEKEADQLAGSPGSINTDEKFQEYHGYADRLLTEILEKYIPTLLRDEDFFSSIF